MSDNLLNDIEKFKSQYYSENNKNTILKTTQKTDLANQICQHYGLEDLFIRTAFIIPRTNRVYIKYPILKSFINPSNHEQFVNYTQSLFAKCITDYGSFECHINMESLTISGVERHRKVIEMFARPPSEHGGIEYTLYLNTLYVYNTPSVIESIRKMLSYLLDTELIKKIVTYNKAETVIQLNKLIS